MASGEVVLDSFATAGGEGLESLNVMPFIHRIIQYLLIAQIRIARLRTIRIVLLLNESNIPRVLKPSGHVAIVTAVGLLIRVGTIYQLLLRQLYLIPCLSCYLILNCGGHGEAVA